MKNLKFSRLFAAVTFVAILALAGCKQQVEESSYAIEGTWVCDDGQKFVITDSTLTNYWGDYDCYAGDSLTVVEISETAGTIFIKYTRSYDPDSPSYYSENGADVGKWYAVSYKDLTDTSVKLSGSAGTPSATLEEAKETHTAGKGCFNIYNDFVKK